MSVPCASGGRRDPVCGVVRSPTAGAAGGNTGNVAAREARIPREACVLSPGPPPSGIPRRRDGPAARPGAGRGGGRWRAAEPRGHGGAERAAENPLNPSPPQPRAPALRGSARKRRARQHQPAAKETSRMRHVLYGLCSATEQGTHQTASKTPQKRKATTQLARSVSKSKLAICGAGKLRTETSFLAVLDSD